MKDIKTKTKAEIFLSPVFIFPRKGTIMAPTIGTNIHTSKMPGPTISSLLNGY